MSKSLDNNRVIVAMSGGVDSSVAALLLCRAGYRVSGATLDTGYGQAAEQAAAVCRQLGIVHQVVDVRQRFRQLVVEKFAAAYLRGETPNPCVNCNAELKFPAFWPLMDQEGAGWLATGHYVRVSEENGRQLLYCGRDPAKDQAYFLWRLDQQTLSRCLFPLGGYSKTQVRELAQREGLAPARQKDSFDVCFLPDGDYRGLLREQAAGRLLPGEIRDRCGKLVGRHQGLANYTVGQRRGLEIALGYPAYVLRIETDSNTLVVGEKDDLLTSQAWCGQVCFQSGQVPALPLRAEVRIRYRSAAVPALLQGDEQREGCLRIDFQQPVWGVTPGQSAVFFDHQLLLGGGVILPPG